MNLFLVIIIGNLSLFFFSYPSTLPKIFYLTPHACIIRGLYYQIKACVEGRCVTRLGQIEAEHWFDLVMPYLHFLIYFSVGMLYYDKRMFNRIKSVVKFRAKKHDTSLDSEVSANNTILAHSRQPSDPDSLPSIGLADLPDRPFPGSQ